jgi:hypothetical protein
MRKVVLFGAGASHGSGYIHPYSPPLGGGLYADLCRHYPYVWGAIPAPVGAIFERDFEQGMLHLVKTYRSAVPPLMRAMTDYFATFAPHRIGLDLYSQLLHELTDAAFAATLFSSLNYECVFELAASACGHPVEYGDRPLDPRAVRVWKLHGSCNFIPDGVEVHPAVQWSSGVQWDPPLRVTTPTAAKRWLQATSLYAAMCLYTVDKPAEIGASMIGILQSEWATTVTEAEAVVVVGTRPHDQDRHLWAPLARARGDLYFCGAHQSFYAWIKRTRRAKRRSHFIGSTFDSAIPTIAEVLNS